MKIDIWQANLCKENTVFDEADVNNMRSDWDRVKHPSVKQAAFGLCLRLVERYNNSIVGTGIAPIPVKNSELVQKLGLDILQLVDDVLECLPHKPENLNEIVRD